MYPGADRPLPSPCCAHQSFPPLPGTHPDDLGALDHSPAGSSASASDGGWGCAGAPLLSRPTARSKQGSSREGAPTPPCPTPTAQPSSGLQALPQMLLGGYSISAYQCARPGASPSPFSPSPRATFCLGLQKQAEDWAAQGMTFSQGNGGPSPGTCALARLLSAHRGSSPECLIFVCSSPVRGPWESG